jgi:hypothetical protein
MKSLNITILLLLITFSSIYAYDPPEILLRVDTPITNRHHWLGDINGDGYDDFLTLRAPRDSTRASTFDFYYGGASMSEEPGFSIPSNFPESVNSYTSMLGHFLPDYPDLLVTSIWYYGVEQDTTLNAVEFQLVSLADSSLGEVVYSYRNLYHAGSDPRRIGPPTGNRLSRPSDFNGDGFDDLVLHTTDRNGENREDRYETLDIYFGGAPFDSTPDWRITRFRPRGSVVGFRVASGYDVNGDGYDDMLVRGYFRIDNDPNSGKLAYEIYLGGAPMDTVPDLRWYYDHFGERELRTTNSNGWAMLPDINNDGHDDWGMVYWESIWHPDRPSDDFSGAYIFFGGEELDIEPDVELSTFPDIAYNGGEILGGDFNEDGIGDIYCNGAANRGEGMTRFYFGRERWDREPEPDLEYRGRIGEGGYGGGMCGSVGDYNGDGADDYIMNGLGEGFEFGGLYIVSGFDDGNSVIENVQFPITPLLIYDVFPNPFNNAFTISVEVKDIQNIEVDIFDISGRRIESLHSGNLKVGVHRFNWESDNSGIYFVVLSSDQGREIRKVVCVR